MLEGQDISSAFLQSTSGHQPASLDRGAKRGFSRIRFGVLGSVGAQTFEQASIGFRLADTPIDGTFALATVTPTVTRFANADVSVYLSHNPMQVSNANVTSADSPSTVSSMEVRPARFDPMGAEQTFQNAADSYQNAGDFQDDRVSIPLDEVLDGYTGLRFICDANATPVSYQLALAFSPTTDRRSLVTQLGPTTVRSSAV